MSNDQQRQAAVRKYVVLRLKLIELMHIVLLSWDLDEAHTPENVLGHSADRFRETLLTVAVTGFMALCDERDERNLRVVWVLLYPEERSHIDQIWSSRITPGQEVMQQFRDKAGAHADDLRRYFEAKMYLFESKDKVITALSAFFGLAVHLLALQDERLPTLNSETEALLLDLELSWPDKSLNRTWLRQMKLTQPGPYRRIF